MKYSDKFIRIGIQSLIEQVLNSALSFAATLLIFANGSDILITQISLSSAFAYGISAVIKSKVITNLYLQTTVSNLSLQIYVITKIRKSMFGVILVSPIVPAISYFTGKVTIGLFIELSILIIVLTSLDLMRNMLINFKKISSPLVSGVFGISIFFATQLIEPDSESWYKLNCWIFSLTCTLFTLCILEHKLVFQHYVSENPTSFVLENESKRSLIESLLVTGFNLVNYFLISQFLIALGAEIQRAYILYCAIPMVISLALIPQFNLQYRNKSVKSSDRLLQITGLESCFVFFPLAIHGIPILESSIIGGNSVNTYLKYAVILSSAANVFSYVYSVWLRSNFEFRKYLIVRFGYLFCQNILVLYILKFFGENIYFFAEIGILTSLVIYIIFLEYSLRRKIC
jgi:hypothetical protein